MGWLFSKVESHTEYFRDAIFQKVLLVDSQLQKKSGTCPNLSMYIVAQNKIEGFITKERGKNT